MDNPLEVNSCCNFIPRAMVNPFPIMTTTGVYKGLEWLGGSSIKDKLHFGSWFSPKDYAVLVDSTVEDKGPHYEHVISTNRHRMKPGSGRQVLDGMLKIKEGLLADIRAKRALRPVHEYFLEGDNSQTGTDV